ncbi:alpha/beta fold hydrolase [Lolliginicoccus suaedae]|uniref:alpha/beta fold hydrolase n=1 Tax=Lolliginicoccus suaedae TaxID=2605429 RepID=UPI001F29D98A|nr:alpha/beta fold hydrolase [Lolliginicoccus suaedae]
MSGPNHEAGARMSFIRTGKGRPLLLVHGLGSSQRNWDPVLPLLASEREVIAVDLPGFGDTPPLPGEVTIATLTDAVEGFIDTHGLGDVDIVGSSMGARMVLEMARRGYAGTVVALDPGGFWTDREVKFFGASIKASIALVRRIQLLLPALARSKAGRTALLLQFSAKPWRLAPQLVLNELRGFAASPSLDDALHALVHGPKQDGPPPGTQHGAVTIGWGRKDRVTFPRQAKRAQDLFPGAELHWFEDCGHFPHWDQPEEAARLILDATRNAPEG